MSAKHTRRVAVLEQRRKGDASEDREYAAFASARRDALNALGWTYSGYGELLSRAQCCGWQVPDMRRHHAWVARHHEEYLREFNGCIICGRQRSGASTCPRCEHAFSAAGPCPACGYAPPAPFPSDGDDWAEAVGVAMARFRGVAVAALWLGMEEATVARLLPGAATWWFEEAPAAVASVDTKEQ